MKVFIEVTVAPTGSVGKLTEISVFPIPPYEPLLDVPSKPEVDNVVLILEQGPEDVSDPEAP